MEDNNNNAAAEPAPMKKEKSRSSIMNILKPKSKDKSPREGNDSDSNIVSPVVGTTTSAIQVNPELEDQVTATENFSERLKVIAKDFAKMEKAVKRMLIIINLNPHNHIKFKKSFLLATSINAKIINQLYLI
jgi:hypothetical protein